MNPIEAGACAIAQIRNSHITTSGPEPANYWSVQDGQMARAAAIAMVGALGDEQVDRCLTVAWNRHPDKRGQEFRAELTRQLTED